MCLFIFVQFIDALTSIAMTKQTDLTGLPDYLIVPPKEYNVDNDPDFSRIEYWEILRTAFHRILKGKEPQFEGFYGFRLEAMMALNSDSYTTMIPTGLPSQKVMQEVNQRFKTDLKAVSNLIKQNMKQRICTFIVYDLVQLAKSAIQDLFEDCFSDFLTEMIKQYNIWCYDKVFLLNMALGMGPPGKESQRRWEIAHEYCQKEQDKLTAKYGYSTAKLYMYIVSIGQQLYTVWEENSLMEPESGYATNIEAELKRDKRLASGKNVAITPFHLFSHNVNVGDPVLEVVYEKVDYSIACFLNDALWGHHNIDLSRRVKGLVQEPNICAFESLSGYFDFQLTKFLDGEVSFFETTMKKVQEVPVENDKYQPVTENFQHMKEDCIFHIKNVMRSHVRNIGRFENPRDRNFKLYLDLQSCDNVKREWEQLMFAFRIYAGYFLIVYKQVEAPADLLIVPEDSKEFYLEQYEMYRKIMVEISTSSSSDLDKYLNDYEPMYDRVDIEEYNKQKFILASILMGRKKREERSEIFVRQDSTSSSGSGFSSRSGSLSPASTSFPSTKRKCDCLVFTLKIKKFLLNVFQQEPYRKRGKSQSLSLSDCSFDSPEYTADV